MFFQLLSNQGNVEGTKYIKNLYFSMRRVILLIGLGTHLFVKVPWPGDSKVTFFGLRVKLPPVTPSLTKVLNEIASYL